MEKFECLYRIDGEEKTFETAAESFSLAKKKFYKQLPTGAITKELVWKENGEPRFIDKEYKLTQWRRKQVKKVISLMERANEITNDHIDLEWLGFMPAYPDKYVKDEFEKDNARDIPYLIEEFNGTLTKLIPEFPKLKEVKEELNNIEAWEDI